MTVWQELKINLFLPGYNPYYSSISVRAQRRYHEMNSSLMLKSMHQLFRSNQLLMSALLSTGKCEVAFLLSI